MEKSWIFWNFEIFWNFWKSHGILTKIGTGWNFVISGIKILRVFSDFRVGHEKSWKSHGILSLRFRSNPVKSKVSRNKNGLHLGNVWAPLSQVVFLANTFTLVHGLPSLYSFQIHCDCKTGTRLNRGPAHPVYSCTPGWQMGRIPIQSSIDLCTDLHDWCHNGIRDHIKSSQCYFNLNFLG